MINENTPSIETRRLILRRADGNDIIPFLELLRDQEVNAFLPWFPVLTADKAEDFLASRFFAYYDLPSAYRYAVCLKDDDRPIGYVWLSDSKSFDLGYGLKKDLWNRGLITEAAGAVAERVKNAGYPYITATHDINNPRSGAVMKKLGMTYRYSYTEQWQPKDFPVTFRMYQLNFNPADRSTYMEYWQTYDTHFVEPLGGQS